VPIDTKQVYPTSRKGGKTKKAVSNPEE